MKCNCCNRVITPDNISLAHVYTFGLFAEIGPRQVVKYATQRRAVCRNCVAAIEAAHQRRRAIRQSRPCFQAVA